MKTWGDIQNLARKLIYEKYKSSDDSLLGSAYIAYVKACDTFNPLKGQFTTHFRHTLLGYLSDEIRATSLVYVPIKQQADTIHSYMSFDTPTNDSTSTLEDILPDTTEIGHIDTLQAFLLAECVKMYPKVNKGLQRGIEAVVEQIKCGTNPPRELRTEVSVVKKILLDKYNENK